MSMLARSLATYSGMPRLYAEDVFNVQSYSGNGSSLVVNTGVDVASKGGMHWLKIRTPAHGTAYDDHTLFDSARGFGVDKHLKANSNVGNTGALGDITAVSSTGFTVSSGRSIAGYEFLALTFRRAKKFFDVITWDGDGAASKQILHGLGIKPGMIMVKRADAAGSWGVWHNAFGTKDAIFLEQSAGKSNYASADPITVNENYFTTGTNQIFGNGTGWKYIAYVFAHDTDVNGLIQCGLYTGGLTTVSNNYSAGSGTINIPAGVLSISVTGQGGTGGDSSWYDPGQPYIAPTPSQPAISDRWNAVAGSVLKTSGAFHANVYAQSVIFLPYPSSQPADQTEYIYSSTWDGTGYPCTITTYYYVQATVGQAAVAGSPGQPYIAPSSGGGIYSGGNTTLTVAGNTTTFPGGYGGPATPSTVKIALSGQAQTIQYNIPSGGSLNISYDVSGGDQTVNLGWEPQFLLIKAANGSGDWAMLDTARGLVIDGPQDNSGAIIFPNKAAIEASTAAVALTNKGFVPRSLRLGNNGTQYIYMAIRRPNKPPTSGQQVYSAVARSGTGTPAKISGIGLSPDLLISKLRTGTASNSGFITDRLRGVDARLFPYNNAKENFNGSNADVVRSFDVDGFTVGSDGTQAINGSGNTIITHCLKRAPGVFDIAGFKLYSGANSRIPHALGAVPELIIVKNRVAESGTNWMVYHSANPSSYTLLNSANQEASDTSTGHYTWGTSPASHTDSDFGIDWWWSGLNEGDAHIAYLFASKPGISKVGSYKGNGSNQIVNCGFSAGARFILIKRTSAAGDWYVWDSVRGIVAANDPHISINTTALEVTTDDSIDPDPSGFSVNQVASTNINIIDATYIYLAIA